METKVCSNCGKEVFRNDTRPRKNYFCNFICKALWQSKQPKEAHPHWKGFNSTCTQCGKPLHVSPSKMTRDKDHFCSKDCDNTFRTGKPRTGGSSAPRPNRRKKFPMGCHYCGKTVMVTQAKLQGRDHVYCGFECRSNWISENKSGSNSHAWKGGRVNYYGPNWGRQQRETRKRDNYTCQRCGITEAETGKALDVHHKKAFRTFGYIFGVNENYKYANQIDNLISLCHACHKKSEGSNIISIVFTHLKNAVRNSKTEKFCASCEEVKPIGAFHKSAQTSDGFHPYCKQCKKKYA